MRKLLYTGLLASAALIAYAIRDLHRALATPPGDYTYPVTINPRLSWRS